MNILSLKPYVFDTFIKESYYLNIERTVNELEQVDKELCKKLSRHRYKIIRIDSRTILTSIGSLTFRRRYVFDMIKGQYFYPLDNKLQIPRQKRISNELTIRILKAATQMTYRQVGENLLYRDAVSKSTICRIIANCNISVDMKKSFDNIGKIHIQIDEKFMSKVNVRRKQKHYTATIFDGRAPVGRKGKMRLLHRTITSSESLDGLKSKINKILKKRYKVLLSTEVYVSGDYANYIQIFHESITCCKAIYVPDKFHSCQALAEELGLINLPKSEDVLTYLQETATLKLKDFVCDSFRKVVRCYRRNPSNFGVWNSHDYEGCSQEGINSHYYAVRFGSRANKFKSETISKLCTVLEAMENGWDVFVKDKTYIVPKFRLKFDQLGTYIPSYEINPGMTHTSGSIHEELDKWLNPIMIF